MSFNLASFERSPSSERQSHKQIANNSSPLSDYEFFDMECIPANERRPNSQPRSTRRGSPSMRRSTYHLDSLKRSSLHEITALTEFRKVIGEERLQKKKIDTLTLKSSNNSNQSSPLERANQKLSMLALTYDPISFINFLSGFRGASNSGSLTKKDLNIQLQRCMNIFLTKAELDALFQHIDENRSNIIDGQEFSRYFLQLRNETKLKITREQLMRMHKRTEALKYNELREKERAKRWEEDQIRIAESDKLCEGALAKLAKVAHTMNPTISSLGMISCRGFENCLSPYEFKRQIEVSFNVRLTSEETSSMLAEFVGEMSLTTFLHTQMGALISKYSLRKGEFCIDGHIFLNQLFEYARRLMKDEANKKKLIDSKLRTKIKSKIPNIDCLFPSLGR